MKRALFRTHDGHLQLDIPLDGLRAAVEDRGGLLWIDFEGEPNESCEPILRDVFGFHPLAIDDALQESHLPRVDNWDSFLYLVVHAVTLDRKDGPSLETLELDVFLGSNYVVTHHDRPLPAVSATWERCRQDDRLLRNGADHLLYEIADRLVTRYMPVIEELDDTIDELENEIFDRAAPATLERLFDLKRAVVELRRIIAPQREAFNRLARDGYAVVSPTQRVYFRDIYDHLVRLHDTTESMRDIVGGALETYLSVINNRLSDVMKTLTIITTLFMPMSFLAGFFGMNFFSPSQPMAPWTSPVALTSTLALMVLVPVALSLWLRRRGWM